MFVIEWKTVDMNYYETTPFVFTTMEKAKAYQAKTCFWVKEWDWNDDKKGQESNFTDENRTHYIISKVGIDPE